MKCSLVYYNRRIFTDVVSLILLYNNDKYVIVAKLFQVDNLIFCIEYIENRKDALYFIINSL